MWCNVIPSNLIIRTLLLFVALIIVILHVLWISGRDYRRLHDILASPAGLPKLSLYLCCPASMCLCICLGCLCPCTGLGNDASALLHMAAGTPDIHMHVTHSWRCLIIITFIYKLLHYMQGITHININCSISAMRIIRIIHMFNVIRSGNTIGTLLTVICGCQAAGKLFIIWASPLACHKGGRRPCRKQHPPRLPRVPLPGVMGLAENNILLCCLEVPPSST